MSCDHPLRRYDHARDAMVCTRCGNAYTPQSSALGVSTAPAPSTAPAECKHNGRHEMEGRVNFLEDVGRYTLDFRIVCDTCRTPFRFVGFPVGLNTERGATVDVDGTELRVAIHPANAEPPPIGGVTGFTIERVR